VIHFLNIRNLKRFVSLTNYISCIYTVVCNCRWNLSLSLSLCLHKTSKRCLILPQVPIIPRWKRLRRTGDIRPSILITYPPVVESPE